MGLDAGTPPGLWERVRKIAAEEVVKFARSGFLRNASISDGGLTIKGGFLRLLTKATGGTTLVYMGPVLPNLPDGTPQQGLIIRRADNTGVLDLYDADVSNGQVNQALTWRDRAGSAVFADDTNSGQGLARPYLPVPFYRARNSDWVGTGSSTFDTLFRARVPKQQPRLYVRCWGTNDTSGATGEVRIMVNGVQLGATASTAFGSVSEFIFGPSAVAGSHMSTLTVEIQARVASGTGLVQVEPSWGQGQQS